MSAPSHVVATVHRKRHERQDFRCEHEWSSRKLNRCGDIRTPEIRMIDRKIPMSSVTTSGREGELEAGHQGAVDCSADLQDHIVIGGGEIEVGREAPCTTQAALSQARAALEDQRSVSEEAKFGKEPECMVLCDIEQCRAIGIGPTRTVSANERARQRWISHVRLFRLHPATVQRGDPRRRNPVPTRS